MKETIFILGWLSFCIIFSVLTFIGQRHPKGGWAGPTSLAEDLAAAFKFLKAKARGQ